jgi:hypothetical protein
MVIVLSTVNAYYAYAFHFRHTFDPPLPNLLRNTLHLCFLSHTAPYINECPLIREDSQVSCCVV